MKSNVRAVFGFLLIAMFLFVQCSDDSPTNDKSSPIDISGYWDIYITVFPNDLEEKLGTFLVIQSGDDITLKYIDTDEVYAAGTLSGSNITLITQVDEPTNITGTVVGDTMSGTWTEINGTGTWRGEKTVEPGDTPEWQTVFFDDFNRSDGDLGNNLSVQVYPAGTVEIVSNKVKITAATEHMMYAINYSEVNANAVRVSIICSTTTINPGQEGYGFMLVARGTVIDTLDNIPRQQYYSGVFGTIGEDLSIVPPSIGISKSTIDGVSTLASKAFEIAENRSYKIVFTVNNKDLTMVVTDMVTAEETTLTATDQNPLTEGIVSLNGYQRNNLVLFIDDFKIEKYE